MNLSDAALLERLTVLATSMAERGLFVRDDFGRANPLAITELLGHEAALRDAARAEQRERDARKADEYAGESARLIAAAIRSGR